MLFASGTSFLQKPSKFADEHPRRFITKKRAKKLIAVGPFDIMGGIIVDTIPTGDIRMFVNINKNRDKVFLNIFYNIGIDINVLCHFFRKTGV